MSASQGSAETSAPARIQVSKQFHLWFDEPPNWDLRSRRMRLSGWCVAKRGAPLTQIRATVRGQIFPGRFDRERPEVAAYVGVPDAPRWCGFTVDVEVPFGKARLELQVAAADSEWRKAYARDVRGPLFVSDAEREFWREIGEREALARYAFFVDRPADWLAPARTQYIAGWCLDRTGEPVTGIRALVAGREFVGNHRLPRHDLAGIYPQLPEAPFGGFAVAAELPSGPQRLQLQAKSDGDVWRTFFSTAVIGGRAQEPPLAPEDAALFAPKTLTPSRFRFWFDRPGDWTAPARHLRISGWCFAEAGADVAEIRARVRSQEFTAAYGIHRPDVAVTMGTGVAVLRCGFSLDVSVPPGGSQVVLEARSKDQGWESFFATEVRGTLLLRPTRDVSEAVGDYAEWIRLHDSLTKANRAAIHEQIASLADAPTTFSVLLPIYNPEPRWLRRALDSVRDQLYPHWELCAVDDASTDPRIWSLLQRYAKRDPRIRITRRATNGHIAAASNDALALASGDFVALLDHDDELAPTALYWNALALAQTPGLQLLYSDEDKLDQQGRRTDPYFKTDWNPDLFTAQNYLSHLGVYRTALAKEVGGFRTGFEGSQDHDLALRCIERILPAQIHHIPRVLYHWRASGESTATFAAAKPYAEEAARCAVQEHFERTGRTVQVMQDYATYLRVVHRPPADEPLVSLVIPTRDRVSLLRRCVESIFTQTDYAHLELIVVDNDSAAPETHDYFATLRQDKRVTIVHVAAEFNFSRLNNVGVGKARGTFVGLLNNDLEVTEAGWLKEMVSHAARPEIGAVGARLWYPDGKMQHGGVILGAGGVATHAHAGIRREHGYFARAHLTQNYSAVTAACMVLRREVYQQLGGLDEVNLPVAFNDVDFCLRLRDAGLRVVWTPHAQLIHHESASRGFEDTSAKQRRFLSEVDYMQRRWGAALRNDPFYNPNLSLEPNEQFKLAFPPRVLKPWRQS